MTQFLLAQKHPAGIGERPVLRWAGSIGVWLLWSVIIVLISGLCVGAGLGLMRRGVVWVGSMIVGIIHSAGRPTLAGVGLTIRRRKA